MAGAGNIGAKSFGAYRNKLRARGSSVPASQTAKVFRVFCVVALFNDWGDVLFTLLRSTQNIGTGSLVLNCGGWSRDNFMLINSPSWTSEGIAFSGTNQSAAMSEDIWGGGASITIMFDANQQNSGVIASIYGVPGQQGWVAYPRTFTTSSNGTTNFGAGTFAPTNVGENKTVMIRYSSGTVTAFVEGEQKTVPNSVTATIFNSNRSLKMGILESGSPNPFSGSIGFFLVSKRSLPDINMLNINASMIALR
jgi:hypothetical protein